MLIVKLRRSQETIKGKFFVKFVSYFKFVVDAIRADWPGFELSIMCRLHLDQDEKLIMYIGQADRSILSIYALVKRLIVYILNRTFMKFVRIPNLLEFSSC